MINLEVEDYCQDCDEFVPCTERLCIEDIQFDRHVIMRVTCDKANRCRRLVRYLQKKVDTGGESMNA